MENIQTSEFNQVLLKRTKWFSIRLCRKFDSIRKSDTVRHVSNQMIRCSTSIMANYSAAIRARSEREFFAKICIVVEECDETYRWLDWLIDGAFVSQDQFLELKKESLELLKIFATTKKTLREKRIKTDRGSEEGDKLI
jgi:four helix bundle protein